MAMLVIAGLSEGGNVAAGRLFSSSPAAASLYPFSGLADSDLGTIGQFGSLTATPLFQVDVDMLDRAGLFESFSGGSPVGWIEANSGTSDVTQESTVVHSGSFAARFAAVGGSASCYKDITVRAGQRLYLEAALRGDAGLGRIKVNLRNLQTGRYLNGGAWSSTPNDVMNYSGTPYDVQSQAFVVEDAATCGTVRPTLRLQLLNDNAGTVSYADSVILIPGVSFASWHGHNIDPRSAPELRASTDNFGASNVLVSTPTLARHSFYTTFPVVYYRYWRTQFADTNTAAIFASEWVLGDALSLARGFNAPYKRTFVDPRITIAKPVGAPAVVSRGTFEQRTLPLSFRVPRSGRAEFFNEVWLRSKGGAPIVVVPYSGDPDVILGVLSGELPEEWPHHTYLDYTTSIEEMGLPLITG